jgi:ketosteroid isomerase-like protein
MPSLDEVLAGGWDFECQGLDEPAGERWKQYRSRMQPLLVKLTRWSDVDGTLLANEYLFDGQSFESAAEAVGASNRMPEPSAEISKAKAQEALFGIHAAWNARDIERFLSFCVDDLAYWINVGPRGGLILFGKDQVSQRLKTWDNVESLSVPRDFTFKDGVIRANIEFSMTNLATGQSFVSGLRQVLMFRDEKICRMEQYFNGPSTAALITAIKEGGEGP